MAEIKIQKYNRIFWDFVMQYDTQNSNILRKIIHSYSVAEKCFSIACQLFFSKQDRELAYLVGLFHDIGRFEQWKIYGTYNDKISVDHGDLGAELLEKFDKDLFEISSREREVLIEAIKFHTKPYAGDDEKIRLFNEIVKNADAFCNILTTANGAQPMTVNENGVSSQIWNDFLDLKPLYIYSPKTKLDRALMMLANTYYVKFDFLRKQVFQNKYIDVIFETFSQYLNEEDKQKFNYAKETLKNKYKQFA